MRNFDGVTPEYVLEAQNQTFTHLVARMNEINSRVDALFAQLNKAVEKLDRIENMFVMLRNSMDSADSVPPAQNVAAADAAVAEPIQEPITSVAPSSGDLNAASNADLGAIDSSLDAPSTNMETILSTTLQIPGGFTAMLSILSPSPQVNNSQSAASSNANEASAPPTVAVANTADTSSDAPPTDSQALTKTESSPAPPRSSVAKASARIQEPVYYSNYEMYRETLMRPTPIRRRRPKIVRNNGGGSFGGGFSSFVSDGSPFIPLHLREGPNTTSSKKT